MSPFELGCEPLRGRHDRLGITLQDEFVTWRIAIQARSRLRSHDDRPRRGCCRAITRSLDLATMRRRKRGLRSRRSQPRLRAAREIRRLAAFDDPDVDQPWILRRPFSATDAVPRRRGGHGRVGTPGRGCAGPRHLRPPVPLLDGGTPSPRLLDLATLLGLYVEMG